MKSIFIENEDPRLIDTLVIPKTVFPGDSPSDIFSLREQVQDALDKLDFQIILNRMLNTLKEAQVEAVGLNIYRDGADANAFLSIRCIDNQGDSVDFSTDTGEGNELDIEARCLSIIESEAQEIQSIIGPRPSELMKDLIRFYTEDRLLNAEEIEKVRETVVGEAVSVRRSLESEKKIAAALQKKPRAERARPRM